MSSLPAPSEPCKLSDAHLRNATLLVDRERLYAVLPRDAVVAELGVARGENAAAILAAARPRELHLFDLWTPEAEDQYAEVRARFAAEIEAGRVRLHRGDDLAALAAFPRGYFDWVYVDSSHQYLHTKRELRVLRHKVREGGIICGHDYVDCDPYMHADCAWYWLRQCVNEFCVRFGWELLHLTLDAESNPSFAIRKIGSGAATAGVEPAAP